jgi:heme oxygenase (biliverdin-IX-beta and delta-forming)
MAGLASAPTRRGRPVRPVALDAMRDATGDAHRRLEERLDIDARLRTPDGFAALLGRLLGFYLPLEERLAPYADPIVGLDYPSRRKAPLLVVDLHALGVATPAAVVPRAEVLPVVDSAAAALGALYVLEGATLGGKLIARRAERALGVTPGTGGAFFGAYGVQVGRRWREFGNVLDDAAGGAPCPAMTAAAVACFAAMEAWLCR